MATDRKEACGNCRFYLVEVWLDLTEADFGKCRRYPPREEVALIPVDLKPRVKKSFSDGLPKFTTVLEESWCGEWREVKSE